MKIFLTLIIFIVLNQTNAYWLGTCIKSDCESTLKLCNTCFGERGCKSCVSSVKPECSECVTDIYNKNDLDLIEDQVYMICDSQDPLQVNVCHVFCRGQYHKGGQCVDFQNVPVCQCNNEQSTSTTTTTTTTTVSASTFSLNFQSKLNISTPDRNYPILALPNGDLIKSAYKSIQIWDTEKGVIKRNLTTNSDFSSPWLLGLLSNGDLVATYRGLTVNRIVIWDLSETTQEPIKRIFETHFPMWSLTILKNDDLAFGPGFDSGNEEETYDIIIIDSNNGNVKQRLIGHTSPVYQIIELPNDRLASCSDDQSVKIWNLLDGSLIRSLAHSDRVYSIALLKNGQLASGPSYGDIHIWDINTGNLIWKLGSDSPCTCSGNCLQVLSNGYLLGGSLSGSLKIWNPNDATLKSIYDTKQMILRMEFLSNGKLVTGSNNEIIIWS